MSLSNNPFKRKTMQPWRQQSLTELATRLKRLEDNNIELRQTLQNILTLVEQISNSNIKQTENNG